jgi:hypothetical protein
MSEKTNGKANGSDATGRAGSAALGVRDEICAAEVAATFAAHAGQSIRAKERGAAIALGMLTAQAWNAPAPDAAPRERRSKHVRAALRVIRARIRHLEELDAELAAAGTAPPGWAARHHVRLAELRFALEVIHAGCEPPPGSVPEPDPPEALAIEAGDGEAA